MQAKYKSWFLADDFSGVLEIGAVWRKTGKTVNIVFDSWLQADNNGICGISSETRNATEDDAKKQLTQLLEDAGDRWLRFKKIDSTMRGPIGAELAIVTKRWPNRPLLFTPTNPDAGRSVKNGCLYVDGIPVSETAFASDPTSPVTIDRVSEIILKTGGPESVSINFLSDSSTVDEVQGQLHAGWKNSQVIVVDGSSATDLKKTVSAAMNIAADFLPCGSGGLARAMDEAGLLSDLDRQSNLSIPKSGRVLFVVGSLHPRSRSQVEYGQDRLNIPVEHVALDHSSDTNRLIDGLIAKLVEEGTVILASQVPVENELVDSKQTSRNAEFLAKLSREVHASGSVDTLFVTGGETARAVVDGLGCQYLELEDEFHSGIAVASMTSNEGQKTTLIVKPGGFGTHELFEQILSKYGKL